MGSSPDATIAWGIQLYDDEGGYDWDDEAASAAHEALGEKLEDLYDLDEILGWTEPHPGWPDHLRRAGNRDTDEHRARQALIDAYQTRLAIAVPLDIDIYGTDQGGGEVLVFKRTKTNVNWGCEPVDPATLTPPTSRELAKLAVVLDHLEFAGDRQPKLLLFASYG